MNRPKPRSLLSHLSPSERRRLPILSGAMLLFLYLAWSMLSADPAFLVLLLPFLALLSNAWFLRPIARAARERALIQHGRRIQGRVVDQRFSYDQPRSTLTNRTPKDSIRFGNQRLVRVGYLDGEGTLHSRELPVQDSARVNLTLDDPITLYIDPRDPDLFTAPSLLAYPHDTDDTDQDARPELLPAPAPRNVDSDASWRDALTDPGDALGWGWWDLLYWRKREQLPAWRLALQGSQLTLQRDQTPHTVDLDQPFTVSLSCWIDAPGTVTLHLHLRQRTGHADAPRLAFSVRLPQDRVDQTVPLQQQHLPTLDASRFDGLWSHIAAHAHLHGDTLRGVQLLDAPALDTAPAEHQHEQLHVGRRAR